MNLPSPLSAPGSSLLKDRSVIVTGAAGAGIGFATAKRCLAEGAAVIISDRHEERLARAVALLRDSSGSVVAGYPCDVTRSADIEALFDFAEAELGEVSVVVNNAGLGGTGLVTEMTMDDWQLVIDVSLGGTFRGTREALRRMTPRRSGVIVNVASVTGWRAEVGQAHYAAAKAGVMALTRCAAAEAAPAGIRINAVAPTITMHPHLEKVSDRGTLDGWVNQQLQKRAATPDEIANVIVFLASDEASYLTGEVISIGSQHP